jgi:hypothetical protein
MYKHFLACLCNGTNDFSLKIKGIPNRDVDVFPLLPSGTYAYFTFDTTISTNISEIPPQDILNSSPITYLGGTLYNFGEVKKMTIEGKEPIKILFTPGMLPKVSEITCIIHTSTGNWHPFFENDILIKE